MNILSERKYKPNYFSSFNYIIYFLFLWLIREHNQESIKFNVELHGFRIPIPAVEMFIHMYRLWTYQFEYMMWGLVTFNSKIYKNV